MTIATVNAKTGPLNTGSSVTEFDYTFQIQDADHLVVTLTSSAGVDSTVSSGSYSVTGVGDASGGKVIFSSAPAAGQFITLTRSVPRTQLVDLANLGGVQPEILEGALDKLTQIVQDNAGGTDTALKVPLSDNSALSTTIPTAATRANKILGFTSTGEPEATTGRVLTANASASALSAGASPTAAVTFTAASGDLTFTLGIPAGNAGATGPSGSNGIFSAIATASEATTGTDNVVGMTPLRVQEAITANAGTVNNACFYGFRTDGASLKVDVTTAGGSETFTQSDYVDVQYASLGMTFSINASGNLVVTTP